MTSGRRGDEHVDGHAEDWTSARQKKMDRGFISLNLQLKFHFTLQDFTI
jgi:hypothetical protein